MGSNHICVLGRQDREIEEGVISQLRGFPRSPTTCHRTLLCHICTSVQKAGKHHFLARSIIAQIMVLTLRKMEGLGLCHTPGCSFCWACPWPETQGSKASAQTTDPLARGPRAPKPPPLADEASDLQRSPDQGAQASEDCLTAFPDPPANSLPWRDTRRGGTSPSGQHEDHGRDRTAG